MKTDDLVAALSAHIEPVNRKLVSRTFYIALTAGTGLTVRILPFRPGLLSIPIIAIVPFAVIIAAVRTAAPTNLAGTGAVAGLVAGGVSAMAYALHCTDDSLPFVAVWYGGTIVLCTLAGAILGPRLLRW